VFDRRLAQMRQLTLLTQSVAVGVGGDDDFLLAALVMLPWLTAPALSTPVVHSSHCGACAP
jgi:hypothetical protein